MIEHAKAWGLLNLSERIGILEVFFYTFISFYMIHLLFSGLDRKWNGLVKATFGLFYHAHLLHFILNMIGFYLYAPSIVSLIGSIEFLKLHLYYILGSICLYMFFGTKSFGYSGFMTLIRLYYLQFVIKMPMDTLILQLLSQIVFDIALNHTDGLLHGLGIVIGVVIGILKR